MPQQVLHTSDEQACAHIASRQQLQHIQHKVTFRTARLQLTSIEDDQVWLWEL
jgi:hypothetical protein